MKITRSILFPVLLSLASTATIAAMPAKPLLQGTLDPQVMMDDLNVLLLYAAKTGQVLDPLELVEITDGKSSDDMRLTLDRYRQSKDGGERLERKSLIEFAVRDRQDSLRGDLPWSVPLAATLAPYDAARKLFPLQLRLDIPGRDREQGKQCLAPYRIGGQELVACLTSSSLSSGDPIFTSLPVADAGSAANIAARYQQGKLRFYALARSAARYTLADMPQGAAGKTRLWNQPLNVVGLLLVDADTNKVMGVAQALDAALQNPGAAPLASAPRPPAPGGALTQTVPADAGIGQAPPSVSGNGERVPADAPLAKRGALPPQPASLQAPGLGGAAASPGGAKMSQSELDRLLSLLSLAVYSEDNDYTRTAAEIDEMEAKISRIEAAPGRNELVRSKELRKLAFALEGMQRKLAEIDAMIRQKGALPTTHGLTPIETDLARKNDKIRFEHYRMRDGRHIIVFRGTATKADLATDFQLAMTPELLSEIESHYKSRGESGVRVSVAEWLRQGADKEVASNPAAFQLADMLVESLVRSGIKPSDIILTGHSLGGGLAQFAGLRHRVGQVVTFNPAPLSQRQFELLPSKLDTVPTSIRNYIAFVPSTRGEGGTFDPVSSGFANLTKVRNTSSLRVVGERRIVTVCNDLDSDDYKAFVASAQGVVTNMTVMTMAAGKGAIVNGATVLGASTGLGGTGTDTASAVFQGGIGGHKAGTMLAAGMNCARHPFLCSAVAAGGGIASAAASLKLPDIWAVYSAHAIKGMYQAMNAEVPPFCSLSKNAQRNFQPDSGM